MKIRNLDKNKIWDYLILVCRFVLAFVFFGYGYSKLTENQFGVLQII